MIFFRPVRGGRIKLTAIKIYRQTECFLYLRGDEAVEPCLHGRAGCPEGVNEAELRNRLMDRYGIEVAGGLGRLAGKVIRIGVMGPLADQNSVNFLLDSIAACL